MIILFIVIFQRLFTMQIINGEKYLNDYTMSIIKETQTTGTRGNIYDRDGTLLAHNELGYKVMLEDNGSYTTTKEKNLVLNAEIDQIITLIEENGDSITNTLGLSMTVDGVLSYSVEGTSLMALRRDVYGRSSISDLMYNKKLGYDEGSSTPEQMYEYLISKFSINTETYSAYRAYEIAVIRYNLSLNSYQKYITTQIATDISDETMAAISEHLSELQGVSIEEEYYRVYDYAEYFSHIIGWTGKISEDEYADLKEQNDQYSLSDIVGKSGIEQVYETDLQGTKGSKKMYVNNTGKVLEVIKEDDAQAGNDIYLSIDADLQVAVYKLLEQELAGILYSKIIDAKEDESKSLYIPIYDVYYALIDNGVLNMNILSEAESGTSSNNVYNAFSSVQASVYKDIINTLSSDTPYSELSDEMKDFITYVVSYLQNANIFQKDKVDSNDSVYKDWKSGTISVKDYLVHAIDNDWIDVSALNIEDVYSDSAETYAALLEYIPQKITTDNDLNKLIYKHMIYNDQLTGTQMCMLLFEQGILEWNDNDIIELKTGIQDAYSFLKEKIKNIEITPAQIGLDPCTGSCVLMDPNTGELLACVSYPGYDTNKLTGNMDTAYYNKLLNDASSPFYNHATQQTTAPGSTYKMVTTAAGLTEGVITTDSIIEDTGIFEKLGYKLKCWAYPNNHQNEDIVGAIRDSCNYYFCEVGYRLSTTVVDGEEVYNEEDGVNTLNKYATMFGLGDKTGIEIPESSPQIATEYPISASIGQSNNSYTTIQLGRYAASLANRGTVYECTLLQKITDSKGNVIESNEPEVVNQIDELSTSTWDAIQTGMREVVKSHSQFNDLEVELAGKTGTAEESKSRPNHALFVGYAPYSDPQIAIACRIANGYTSGNTCDFADTVMKYYFNQSSADELLNGQAASVSDSGNNFTD